jgi:hypothetical protein
VARGEARDNYGTVRPDPRRRSFAQMPRDLLLDRAVSDRAVRLWGILDRIAAGREAAIGSRAGLAESLGCSTASLDRARRELEAAGWLGIDRVEGEASRYTVYDFKTESTALITGDYTQMGVFTGDEGPSSPVTNPPSSPVNTEGRGTTRERDTSSPHSRSTAGHVRVAVSGEEEGGRLNDEAEALLALLPDPFRTGPRTRATLRPAVVAAFRAGWSAVDLRSHLAANPTGVRNAGAVLGARLGDLPPAPAVMPPDDPRDPWCGACDERTRLAYDEQADRSYRCPDCHPLRDRNVS